MTERIGWIILEIELATWVLQEVDTEMRLVIQVVDWRPRAVRPQSRSDKVLVNPTGSFRVKTNH